MKKLTDFNEINTFLNSELPKPVELKTIPNMMHANQVKLIDHSEKEYKELKKENRKLKKETSCEEKK